MKKLILWLLFWVVIFLRPCLTEFSSFYTLSGMLQWREGAERAILFVPSLLMVLCYWVGLVLLPILSFRNFWKEKKKKGEEPASGEQDG